MPSSFVFLPLLASLATTLATECECAGEEVSEAATPARNQVGNLVLVFISALQVICTYYAMHKLQTRGWEPLWVIGIEVLNYFTAYVRDGEESFIFNGNAVPFLRFASWLVTCPVLLMYLVAMTTCAGRPPAVRLVPLLIANQCMILAGITATGLSGMAKWLFYIFALTNGSVVFTFSFICLIAIRQNAYELHGESARNVATLMATCFIVGWGFFPLAYTTGSHGTSVISKDTEAWLFIVGDLLSKNFFCGLSLVLKGRYLTKAGPAQPEGGSTAAARRRPSMIVTAAMNGEDVVTAAMNGGGAPKQEKRASKLTTWPAFDKMLLASASCGAIDVDQTPTQSAKCASVKFDVSPTPPESSTSMWVHAAGDAEPATAPPPPSVAAGDEGGGLETDAVLRRAEVALDKLVMLLSSAGIGSGGRGAGIYAPGELDKANCLAGALARLAHSNLSQSKPAKHTPPPPPPAGAPPRAQPALLDFSADGPLAQDEDESPAPSETAGAEDSAPEAVAAATPAVAPPTTLVALPSKGSFSGSAAEPGPTASPGNPRAAAALARAKHAREANRPPKPQGPRAGMRKSHSAATCEKRAKEEAAEASEMVATAKEASEQDKAALKLELGLM